MVCVALRTGIESNQTQLPVQCNHDLHTNLGSITVSPRVEAAATVNLTCSSTAATTRGRLLLYKYKKQLQKIERKVGMEYQKAYKQG